jgi:hypothetical protein
MTMSFAAAPQSPAAVQPSLLRWEQLTRRANHAAYGGHTALAIFANAQALWVAQALLEERTLQARPDDCLAALVVSHHNLADLYRGVEHTAAAVEHLCTPHLCLLRLLHDEAQPSRVREAASRHLRETRAVLLGAAFEREWQQFIDRALAADSGPPARLGATLH